MSRPSDSSAGDSLGAGTEDSFVSTDFEAPADAGAEFAAADSFESESFEG